MEYDPLRDQECLETGCTETGTMDTVLGFVSSIGAFGLFWCSSVLFTIGTILIISVLVFVTIMSVIIDKIFE